jgi:hypothetical protein
LTALAALGAFTALWVALDATGACLAAGLAAGALDDLATGLETLGELAVTLAAVLDSLAAAMVFPTGLALGAADGLVAVFAPGLEAPEDLVGSALEDFCAALRAALATGAGAGFFVAGGFGDAPRPEADLVAPGVGVDSAVVLATAFAGDLEAFAFTSAPFLVSAASTVVGKIGLSCHDEGN